MFLWNTGVHLFVRKHADLKDIGSLQVELLRWYFKNYGIVVSVNCAPAASYVDPHRKPVTYTETIEPVSIARRIMEIREQVADMLSSDLKQMAAENAKLQLDYAAEVYCSDPPIRKI